MHPKHMMVLMTCLVCRRSPYILEVEKETAAYRGADENFTAHLLSRPDLKTLFRAEIQDVIREAREA